MKSRFFKLVLSAVFLSGSLAAEEKQAKPPVRLTIEKRKNQIAYLDLEFARVGNVPVFYDKAGLKATFQIVEGAGHGGPQYRDAKRKKLILDMFAKQLRGE